PQREAAYARLGIVGQTRAVSEYAVQAPGLFLRNLGGKALFAVGLFGQSGIPGQRGTSWWYVGMWCAALAGVIRILASPRAASWALKAIPGAAAVSHFLSVVLIFPYGYGDRLILPLYPLLIPYAAFAIE